MYKLMIKTYSNGKKYLCQTSRDDWETYKGSGIMVKDNPELILEKTELIGEYADKSQLRKAGIYYSDLFDVVENPDFMNLCREEGQGGHTLYTEKRNKKISEKLKNKTKSTKHKEKLSEKQLNKVVAWDKVNECSITVTRFDFENNDDLVGIASVKAKGIPKSDDWKKKMSKPKSEEHKEKLRGPNPKKSLPSHKHGMSKPITFEGVDYSSISEASRILNKNKPWIMRRLVSDKFPDSFFKEK